MAQATGRVTIKLDGDIIRSRSGASMQMGGINRTALSLDSGDVHYTEEIVPSQVTATVVHLPDTDIIAFRSLRDFTCSFETDTGAGWVINNAFVTEVGDITSGEFTITIMGPPANRVI